MKPIRLLCASTLALAMSQAALADCTTPGVKLITQAPYVIKSAGSYCLANDIVVSGKDAAAIEANNIDLGGDKIDIDLNNYKISFDKNYTNAGAFSTGIFLFFNNGNASVYNGAIDGFHYGFQANGGNTNSTLIIDNVDITSTKINDTNDSTGISANKFENLEVLNSRIESSYDLYNTGDIVSNGYGVAADANTQTTIKDTSINAAHGISVSNGDSVTVKNAVLLNDGDYDNQNYGIFIGTMNKSNVDNITIAGFQSGLTYFSSKASTYSDTDVSVYGKCVVGRAKAVGSNNCTQLQ